LQSRKFFAIQNAFKEKNMKPKHWTCLALVFVILSLFLVPSCAKKKISSEPATTSAEEQARREAEARERERQQALKEEDLKEGSRREQEASKRLETERSVFENKDIHFEFDSIRLTPEAQELLRQKAKWLRENPRATVIIEGHCDNRGTNEYNLALGEGRAQSAKMFLVDLGIKPPRLKTISFGEERPIDTGQDEEAWAKNRRAHFVIED